MEQAGKKRKRGPDDAGPLKKGAAQGNVPPAPSPGPVKGKAKAAANDDASLRSLGRKKTFKHSLDSPHAVKWATLPDDLAERLLDQLCSILKPLGDGKQTKREIKKQKRREKKSRKDKDASADGEAAEQEPEPVDAAAPPGSTSLSAPADLPGIFMPYIGINGVTRHLQKAVRTGLPADIDCVFLCKQDANPPHLYAHLPVLCQMARRSGGGGAEPACVPLIPLPKGSENKLAATLTMKRVIVLGLKRNPSSEALFELVGSVKVPPIPWLPGTTVATSADTEGSGGRSKEPIYANLQIKTVETTAPIVQKKGQQPKKGDKTATMKATDSV